MKTLLLLTALFVPFVAEAAPATAAKPMAVCVAQATGAVTARPKCKAGESPLSLAAVAAKAIGPQGPIGPQGLKGDQGVSGILNVASCYQKQGEWQLTNDGEALASADCNNPSTEFMLSDGMDYQPFVSVFLKERNPFTKEGDTVPTGIFISTFSSSKVYQLRALITCCKR